MSQPERNRADAGVTLRHARSCPSTTGSRCSCTPTFQAQAFDARSGKRVTRTFPTITGARRWKADAASALREGRMTADLGPTLTEAAEEWLAAASAGVVRNRSGDPFKPSAIRGYETNLRLRVLPELGTHRLGELRLADLQRFIDRMATQGLEPATIMTSVTPLRSIFRRAAQLGVVGSNPTRGLSLPAVRSRRDRIAGPKEAAELLTALEPGDRPLWATALFAGLRRGELVALRWEDVDLATGLIRVCRGWDAIEGEISPKTAKGKRNVPVPAALRDYLVEHRMNRAGEGVVFGTLTEVRRAAERARGRWRDSGLEALTLHEARHTYASLMIAAGVNAKVLSTFMGHANIAITLDLYGHLLPGSEAEAAGLLDSFLQSARGADPDTDCSADCSAPTELPAKEGVHS